MPPHPAHIRCFPHQDKESISPPGIRAILVICSNQHVAPETSLYQFWAQTERHLSSHGCKSHPALLLEQEAAWREKGPCSRLHGHREKHLHTPTRRQYQGSRNVNQTTSDLPVQVQPSRYHTQARQAAPKEPCPYGRATELHFWKWWQKEKWLRG